MNLIKRILQKPEYFFKPRQIIYRVLYNHTLKRDHKQVVTLPWNIPIEVNINEVIGKSIYFFGLYDLSLTESVNRIVKKDDLVFDIGANVGYVTSLMSFLVGSRGGVFSFEPNPLIIDKFRRNIIHIEDKLSYSNITLHQKALSDSFGESELYIPFYFAENEGTASLEAMNDSKKIVINRDTLDNYIADKLIIKLLKVDVEGHELSVFRGAIKSFEQRRVKNIIFENHSNSEIINFLAQFGFTIYRINKTFRGVQLSDHDDDRLKISYEADNFLATLSPIETKVLFQNKGWTVYSY